VIADYVWTHFSLVLLARGWRIEASHPVYGSVLLRREVL
jgi:hypothetical protein